MSVQLSLVQLEHSTKLSNLIDQEIQNNRGWISFDRFMHLALYSPGLGYYSAGSENLGEGGDFITAPMLGDQFAGCLGRQCVEILENLDTDQPKTIVEFGAGTGQLIVDLLGKLISLGCKPDKYLVVETSADLQHRQKSLVQACIPEYLDIIKWCAEIPQAGVSGVILANELLDSLPVMLFKIDEKENPIQLGVLSTSAGFELKMGQQILPKPFSERVQKFSLSKGYQSEIGSYAEAWVRTVGEKLNNGAMILIDYGFPATEFYHSDRKSGTLMCHFQHKAYDNPFENLGMQDITAHVDFSAIAQAGREVELEVAGYCSQGGFLISLDLLQEFEAKLNHSSPNIDSINRAQEIKKLTLPHEMGELFKVIVFTKNYSHSMQGFKTQNHMGRL